MQPDWSKATNFVDTDVGRLPILPTIVCGQDGKILSLVWSSERSLKLALEKRLGIYESRKRGLWIKSPSGVNGQRLLSYSLDCDLDALLFVVVQRGHACHLDRESCFQVQWQDDSQFKIGICSGRGKPAAIDLLATLGFHVYANAKARSTDLLCKTHLHHNVKIVECKPRDLQGLLESGFISMAVGFSDYFQDPEQCRTSDHCKKVEIVLFGQSTQAKQIFTEYDLSNLDLPAWLKPSQVIKISGNAEGIVKSVPDSVGITVYDSGETLRANNLQVLQVLKTAQLGVYFSNATFAQEPRLFRSITNDLTENAIYFYSVDGPFGFMSNFYPTEGTYKSSEHYYQAGKFLDPADQALILACPTAKQCYKLAWQMKDRWRSDWFSEVAPVHPWQGQYLVKDAIMWEALQIKFGPLLDKLLATGTKRLIEHALKDDHFGCGIDGQGLNVLGRMLMLIRNRI